MTTSSFPLNRHKPPAHLTPGPDKRDSSPRDWQFDHIAHVSNPAYAPYNFVPINREVVEAAPPTPPFAKNEYYTQRNGTKGYTGWIDVGIEALTPLYIRGTLTKKEVEDGVETKEKHDFCAPAGKIRIPGSSLRGMVRNMLEIVSFGRFHFFRRPAALLSRIRKGQQFAF